MEPPPKPPIKNKNTKDTKKQPGRRLTFSAITVKKVAPGAIAAPEELVASELTHVVPTMFSKRPPPVAPVRKPVATTVKPAIRVSVAPEISVDPEISVNPQEPEISVQEPPPEISVQEPPPEISVKPQEPPPPEISVQEPPKISVQEPTIKTLKRPTIRVKRPKFSATLKKYKDSINAVEQNDPYKEVPTAFVPQNRKGFTSFIVKTYGDFALPLKLGAPDMEACQKMGAAGEDTTKMYLYQQFVREYVRQESPYRGTLVYHGLGSGKTCSAIAAMEALYGTSGKRIIVMTPFSLQNNFLTEITFCGFRHFRLHNHWVRIEVGDDPTAALFAKEVMKIPDTFFAKQARGKKKSPAHFYVPDFDQPANFDTLSDDTKAEIREQIFAILRNRITFISYNGIRASQLKIWACSEPEFFDNAVIIIDEIHNLTRLMQGTIEPYLAETPGQKRRIAAEPITPGKWSPKLCNVSANYKRAFLFYRLLCSAKNTKIIGLSGTPIVNFPEELGILANVLHGYIDSATATIPQKVGATQQANQATIEKTFLKLAAAHPRIDFFKIIQTQSAQQILISAVPEGYKKIFNEDGSFLGFENVGDDAVPNSIQEILADLEGQLRDQNILISKPEFAALPLLPPDGETFSRYFIDAGSLKVTNEIVLSKRLSGLISYYKGSKEEFMPKVVRDEYVEVPFTEYSLVGYLKARRYEQEKEEIEKTKKKDAGKTKVVAAWSDVLGIAKKNPSSYRFRSRAACNFVFPEKVPRPFPDNDNELEEDSGKETGDIITDQDITDTVYVPPTAEEEAAAAEAVKEDEIEDQEGKTAATATAATAAATATTTTLSYKQRIASAIEALRGMKDSLFTMDPPNLTKYSPKYAEILKRIDEREASALVYSQFRTLEGIGLFGVALEANGYIPIEILGSDQDPYFSPRTEESFRKHFAATLNNSGDNTSTVISENSNITNDNITNDNITNDNITSNSDSNSNSNSNSNDVKDINQSGGKDPIIPKKRYILYSGEETRERRNLLINLFNARFDRLPPKITQVLKESGFEGPTNKKGDICKVISITGAGAEGLSLKNVRSVHIMEPFWNPVRTDQVKGRAVRICSHSELPVEERTVEVFTYVSIVSQDMITKKLVDESFVILDNARTSDQFIQGISETKKRVTDDILRVMKQSAVDCTLNSTENSTTEETIKCFRIKGGADDFMYDPRIAEDVVETERSTRFDTNPVGTVGSVGDVGSIAAPAQPPQPTTAKYTVIGIKGKQYIAKPQPDGTSKVYNARDRFFEKELGTRIYDPLTGKYKTTFKPEV